VIRVRLWSPFLCTLDEAFVLAKRLSARNFGMELGRRARSQASNAP
jgi:hypothetical protein